MTTADYTDNGHQTKNNYAPRHGLWQNQSMKSIRLLAVVTLLVGAVFQAACVSQARSELVNAQSSKECVVLLHGLNRSWKAMRPMAEALQNAGFTTANIDYPSQSGPIEEIAPVAVGLGLDECRRAGASTIHFVTHSLGGILVRYQNSVQPIPDIGRVVMLGPPNQGSELVDQTRGWPGFEMLSGDAGAQLGTNPESMAIKLGPVDFELGVIAGTGTINLITSAMLPDPDDGKVSVARTRVDGMDDFLIVSNSHRYMLTSDIVFRNTQAFLRDGAFITADKQLFVE